MKIRFITILISFTLLIAKNDTLIFDIDKSQITWAGNSIKGGHNGQIKRFNGFIIKDKDRILKGELIVDMNTLKNDDIENIKMKKKLIDRLKGPDFFNVDYYPKSKFTFYEVKITDDGIYLLGEMNIKDKVVKKNIKLESIDSHHASGKISINRNEYNIYPGFLLNLMIDNKFDIFFKIRIK